jgi:dihydroneopterin aldolase
MSADTITLADLEVHYHVGVPDAERAQPQRLLLTIEMQHDFTRAAASDDLRETIDYYAVSRRLLNFGEGRSWKLIEKLAADIAAMVLADFGAEAVTVEVKKFIIPEARHISVRLSRGAAFRPQKRAKAKGKQPHSRRSPRSSRVTSRQSWAP